MIDLHCHILPELDDGPQDLAESLAMAAVAVDNGIHTVVATPHTLNGQYRNHIDQIEYQAARLRQALIEKDIPLTVHFGAEVHAAPDLMLQVDNGFAPTINNMRKYLLLELPAHNLPPRLKETIFQLQLAGITPILAHPERNLILQHNLQTLDELVRMGTLCQVTAFSVTGRFGAAIRQCTAGMLESGLVHIIASDSHGTSFRQPDLSEAVTVAGEIFQDHGKALEMVTTTPEAIIAGESITIPEPSLALPKKRKWFGFFQNGNP
ncbi:MAG: hypothetical protein L3J03_08610 [Desulfobacterales bacterium]|nr:hypothetical protein [Desulfobacterales bacterium]